MIKAALEHLIGLARPATIDVESIEYWTASAKPVQAPFPASLEFPTLQGLCEFVVDIYPKGYESEKVFFAVGGFSIVTAYYDFETTYDRREVIGSAKTQFAGIAEGSSSPIIFSLTAFVNWLKTQTVLGIPGGNAEELIESLTYIDYDAKTKFNDSGSTQEIVIQKGISQKEKKAIPNPVLLAPYRTFIDVEQPASNYFVRISYNPDHDIEPVIALTLADGGQWKNTAVDNIKKKLNDILTLTLDSKIPVY